MCCPQKQKKPKNTKRACAPAFPGNRSRGSAKFFDHRATSPVCFVRHHAPSEQRKMPSAFNGQGKGREKSGETALFRVASNRRSTTKNTQTPQCCMATWRGHTNIKRCPHQPQKNIHRYCARLTSHSPRTKPEMQRCCNGTRRQKGAAILRWLSDSGVAAKKAIISCAVGGGVFYGGILVSKGFCQLLGNMYMEKVDGEESPEKVLRISALSISRPQTCSNGT